MKTYIVIFILFVISYNCRASDKDKNDEDLIEVTTSTPKCEIKPENNENKNGNRAETEVNSPTIVFFKGDEYPKGYSRADDRTCLLKE